MNALLLLAALPAAPVSDVKLPTGFSAHLYSDQNLANDIYTMTVDDAGRVLVAGKGYVRQLIDDNGDGKADRAVNIITNLKDGPMGLLAEGDSLYVVADGGLKRYQGILASGGRQPPDASPKPELLYAVKTSGEHEAHAVRRGPDGWLYLMCGNMSGVKKEHLDPIRSPVKDPVAGSLLRISPDGKTIEAVADGFRNAYDFDFNLDGEAFTFDSDNERCVGLPWYEPCRFYHVVPSGNYGWRSPQLSQTWRKPPYFADVVAPIATTGRGSPTGVACYRNTLFPSAYRGNFFIADWTFGKIWFVPLEKKHSTYTGKPEVFLEAVGESGFAPTALAVHPKTGELFVSIGGRGTRGAVYRIAHDRGGPAAELPIAKRSLDWTEAAGKRWMKEAVGDDAMTRRQALESMLRYRDKLGWGQFLGDAVKPSLSDDDPLLRAAAAQLVARAAAPINGLTERTARLTVALVTAAESPEHALQDALEAIESPIATFEQKLIATRVIHLAFGDLSDPKLNGTFAEGYGFRMPLTRVEADRIVRVLQFPDTRGQLPPVKSKLPAELEREYGRLLGAALGLASTDKPQTYRALEWMCGHLTAGLSAESDFHYLAALSQIDTYVWRDQEGYASAGLLGLQKKLERSKLVTDRNWPLRFDELCAGMIPKHPYLSGRLMNARNDLKVPEQLSIIRHMKLKPAEKAEILLNRTDKSFTTWNAGMLEIASALPARLRPIIDKELWPRGGLEDAILPILANDPRPEDGPKFLVGLRSANPEAVKVSATALLKIKPQKDQAEIIGAILALRKLPEDKAKSGTREALITLLKIRGGQPLDDAKSWTAWFAKEHPELAAKLNATDGFDAAAWKKREPNIPWADGDAVRGRAVFAKATCAACHDGGGAIGPSLAGVSKRFSRDDLLTAILQPSKDVASRYRPTRLTTKDDKVYVGMIVYEAVSGVILQTGPDAVVRIDGAQIESQKLLDTSLMPAGLLEKLNDGDIADLIAYLRSG